MQIARANQRIVETVAKHSPEYHELLRAYMPSGSPPHPGSPYFVAFIGMGVAALADSVDKLSDRVGVLESAAKPRPRGRPRKEDAAS
jgi:hypothetical protein